MSTPDNLLPPPEPPSEEAGTAAAPAPAAAVHAGVEEKYPEDIRTPWGWAELLLFVVFGFTTLIVLNSILAAVAMVWPGVKQADLLKFVTTNAIFISVRQVFWFAAIMLYLFVLLRLRRGVPFWRTIGWRRLHLTGVSNGVAYLMCLLGGVALAVAIQAASLPFHPKTSLPIEALFRDRRGVLWLMAIGVLAAPLVEETIFRGYLYPVLARSLGVTGGVLATGALFGLMHAPQLWGGWAQIGLLTVVGIVLTYARARTGTVVTSFLVHLSYNSFLFSMYLIVPHP